MQTPENERIDLPRRYQHDGRWLRRSLSCVRPLFALIVVRLGSRGPA
jgi:hypothetical protein